jgi:hypothetical protein
MVESNPSKPVNFLGLTGLTGSVTEVGKKTPCIPREEDSTGIRVKTRQLVKCDKIQKSSQRREYLGRDRKETVMATKIVTQAVQAFVDDACKTGVEHWSTPSDLYSAYSLWATSNGMSPMSKIQFGSVLTEFGFRRSMMPGGINIRLGISPRLAA